MNYGKLNNGIIICASKNKGAISNYYLNEENLLNDGYLPIIEKEYPQDGNRYLQVNQIIDGKIVINWQKIELSYQELRELEYPNIGDMIDAICKKLDGDSEEYNKLQTLRLEIKDKYQKDVSNDG